MGPRSRDRGNLTPRLASAAIASMGPRSGIAEMCSAYERYRHASMGPRSRDRGNATSRAKSTDGFNGAAIPGSRKCDRVAIASQLQWGRDPGIAEILPMRMHCERCAQASMGPRSRDRGNDDVIAVCGIGRAQASMGPRSRDRGNSRGQVRHCRTLAASMGPRSRDRGNSATWTRQCASDADAHCRLPGSFNGAAIPGSRKCR